eukprot:gene15702-biopygen11416
MRSAQVSERLSFPGPRGGGLPRRGALGVPRSCAPRSADVPLAISNNKVISKPGDEPRIPKVSFWSSLQSAWSAGDLRLLQEDNRLARGRPRRRRGFSAQLRQPAELLVFPRLRRLGAPRGSRIDLGGSRRRPLRSRGHLRGSCGGPRGPRGGRRGSRGRPRRRRGFSAELRQPAELLVFPRLGRLGAPRGSRVDLGGPRRRPLRSRGDLGGPRGVLAGRGGVAGGPEGAQGAVEVAVPSCVSLLICLCLRSWGGSGRRGGRGSISEGPEGVP